MKVRGAKFEKLMFCIIFIGNSVVLNFLLDLKN